MTLLNTIGRRGSEVQILSPRPSKPFNLLARLANNRLLALQGPRPSASENRLPFLCSSERRGASLGLVEEGCRQFLKPRIRATAGALALALSADDGRGVQHQSQAGGSSASRWEAITASISLAKSGSIVAVESA